MKLFLLRIRTTYTEMLDHEKIILETSINCWWLTRIIAVIFAMINHISYGLNLPNTVSTTWCMSLLGHEEGFVNGFLGRNQSFVSFYAVACRQARSQKLTMGGGWWFGGLGAKPRAAGGQGGQAPSCRRLGVWGQTPQPPEARGLGAEPPALENFACFCKNNFILGLF